MKSKISTVSRYLLGLIFAVFGVAGLFNLIPPPPDMPESLINFMTALTATGYFIQFVKITEIVGGLMLLAGLAPALSLVILAPITINIFLVHLFLTPGLSNLAIPFVMIVLHVLAAIKYWDSYRQLFNK